MVASTLAITSNNLLDKHKLDLEHGRYIVRPGDRMEDIAKEHGLSVEDLKRANPQLTDAGRIVPGQELNIPDPSPPATGGVTGTTESAGPRRPRPNYGLSVPRMPNGGLDTNTLRASLGGGANLERGAQGPEVVALQHRLQELGFSQGTPDGNFGTETQRALQAFQTKQNLTPNGVLNPNTRAALDNAGPAAPPAGGTPVGDPHATPAPAGNAPVQRHYEPGSPEAIALFEQAARVAGVPESWARSPGLHQILRHESNGDVGRPNYSYGARASDPAKWGSVQDELRAGRQTARSSATGLGQLLLTNVDHYYPSGRAGIGKPVDEAVGMLRYIQDRYGTPDNAWAQYGRGHEGY